MPLPAPPPIPHGLFRSIDVVTVVLMVVFVGYIAWFTTRWPLTLLNWPPRRLIWISATVAAGNVGRGALSGDWLLYVVAAAWAVCTIVLIVTRRVMRARAADRAAKATRPPRAVELPPSLVDRLASRRRSL